MNYKKIYTLYPINLMLSHILQVIIKRDGVCLSQNLRDSLKDGEYEVVIDSKLFSGNLNYGEIILPGKVMKKFFYQLIFVILLWPIMNCLAQQLQHI